MSDNNSITIIINNYNYARFLSRSVDSVLQQTVKPYEVIVVDDGSTDDSIELLARYKDKVRLITKKNGGQASAFNSGFSASTGKWIWFVDADDWLQPDAVEKLRDLMEPGVVKIHSPLILADKHGNDLAMIYPQHKLSEGVVIGEVEEFGDYHWPPTTGNIFLREMLEKCFPVPEEEYRLCADFYVNSFAAMQGRIKASPSAFGYYRIHDSNGFYGFSLDKTRVKNRGMMLLKAVDRIEELMKKYSANKLYQYPYSRWFLESLAISRRFGELKLPATLTGIEIHRKWFGSVQFKKTSGKARLSATLYWMMLNYAPKPIAAYLIRKGIHKAEKANAKSSLGLI